MPYPCLTHALPLPCFCFCFCVLKEGEPVEFILGKRMLCEQSSGPRREGFLVYDCAAVRLRAARTTRSEVGRVDR